MGLRESVKERIPVANGLNDKEWADYVEEIKKKGIDFEDLYKLGEDAEKIKLEQVKKNNNHPIRG